MLPSPGMSVERPPCSPELEDLISDYVRDGWNRRDERYRGAPLAERNGVVVDQDFMSQEEIRRSAFYQELMWRHDCPWFAAVCFKTGGGSWVVTIQRSAAQGPFLEDEVGRLKDLIRPLGEAATLAQKLGFARVRGWPMRWS